MRAQQVLVVEIGSTGQGAAGSDRLSRRRANRLLEQFHDDPKMDQHHAELLVSHGAPFSFVGLRIIDATTEHERDVAALTIAPTALALRRRLLARPVPPWVLFADVRQSARARDALLPSTVGTIEHVVVSPPRTSSSRQMRDIILT